MKIKFISKINITSMSKDLTKNQIGHNNINQHLNNKINNNINININNNFNNSIINNINNNVNINNNFNNSISNNIKNIQEGFIDYGELDMDSIYLTTKNKLSDIVFNNNMNNLSQKDLHRVDNMVKDKLNLMDYSNALKLSKIRDGYKSYEHRTVLGDLRKLLTADSLTEVLLNKLFNQFEVNKGYTLLFQLDYITNGKVTGVTPMKSMIVTFDTNINLISGNVIVALNKVLNEYSVDGDSCRLSVI